MNKVFLLLGVFTLSVLGVVSLAAGNPAAAAAEQPPAKSQVMIDNFSFMPATLTIPAGTNVIWVNRDDVPHTVVSTENKFSSSVLDTDQEFSYTFTDPGTYEYFCSVHPRMTAKVIVQKRGR